MSRQIANTTIICDILLFELLCWPRSKAFDLILAISGTTRFLRSICLPFIFKEVRWPNKYQVHADTGLLFFPEHIWRYIRYDTSSGSWHIGVLKYIFRHFRLVWPDEWADAMRSQWGQIVTDSHSLPHPVRRWYIPDPQTMAMLVSVVPKLPALETFYASCPFPLPGSLFASISQCPKCISLTLDEIPIGPLPAEIPESPLPLKKLSIRAVLEALRVGDGSHNSKYSEVKYYTQEWKKKYRPPKVADSIHRSHAAFTWLHAPTLTHLELSGGLYSFAELSQHEWPELQVFSLTGRVPSVKEGEALQSTQYGLVDALMRMPKIQDLRLLFSQSSLTGFPQVPLGAAFLNAPTDFKSVTSLAISHALMLGTLLQHLPLLERVAVVAIIDHPRVPIALSLPEAEKLLEYLGGQGFYLRRLRLMLEDKLTPQICQSIAASCPNLEDLEIEMCGYHDGISDYTWVSCLHILPLHQISYPLQTRQIEFADALKPLSRLLYLRICIPFPEYNEDDELLGWLVVRRKCAQYLASQISSLFSLGLEYRKRMGSHRFQDEWLEYEVQRKDGEVFALFRLESAIYPFPSVWDRVIGGSG